MGRTRTNIELDDEHLDRIMQRFGIRTKTEAVDLALRHLAGQPMTREEALAMRGGGRVARRPRRHRRPRRRVILVDTSAWVEFDRATDSAVDAHLAHLIETTDLVAVTEPIVMEVLAGARDDRRQRDLQRLMDRFALLRFDATADFAGASAVYRRCRKAGVTPRGLIDCMIAAVAVRHRAALLTADRDLRLVADVMEIDLSVR